MPLKVCIQIYLNISMKYILIYLNSSQDREFIQNYKKQRNNQNDLDWIIRSINYSRWWKTGIHFQSKSLIMKKIKWLQSQSKSDIEFYLLCQQNIFINFTSHLWCKKAMCVCVYSRVCVFVLWVCTVL